MLVVMVSVIFSNNKSSEDFSELEKMLTEYKIENQTVRSKNIAYLETRLNRTQETQDTYQVLTDRRFMTLDAQVKLLMEANKANQRVINTNINTVGNLTTTTSK